MYTVSDPGGIYVTTQVLDGQDKEVISMSDFPDDEKSRQGIVSGTENEVQN